jgi:hypothetical protein
MEIKSNVRAGALGGVRPGSNHNQTVSRGLKVKTNIKAGDWPLSTNHNQSVASGLKVKSGVKAGIVMRKSGGDPLSAGKPF